jgi:hypothetical protein
MYVRSIWLLLVIFALTKTLKAPNIWHHNQQPGASLQTYAQIAVFESAEGMVILRRIIEAI